LTPKIKKHLVNDIHRTFATAYPYHGRKVTLESILQRQVYRLVGTFMQEKKYRPYLFRW